MLGILTTPPYCNQAYSHSTAISQDSTEATLNHTVMVLKQTTFCNPNDLLNMLLKSGNYIMEYPAYQNMCLPLRFKITETVLVCQ